MKYEDLIKMLGKRGFFDLASVVQLTDERRESIRVQLYRWCKSGKLLPLRRGMYAFANPYRLVDINPAELANKLYTPSYLSTYWAMGFYGLIPEKVVGYTSVTSRVSKLFGNEFGAFRYQSVKREGFFGCRTVSIDGSNVLVAEPEKALLDLWHFEKGKWEKERMRGMRFQNTELIDLDRLKAYALKYQSPKLVRAVDLWEEIVKKDNVGTREL